MKYGGCSLRLAVETVLETEHACRAGRGVDVVPPSVRTFSDFQFLCLVTLSAAQAPDKRCFTGTNGKLSSNLISLQIEKGGPAVDFNSRAGMLSSQLAPQQ